MLPSATDLDFLSSRAALHEIEKEEFGSSSNPTLAIFYNIRVTEQSLVGKEKSKTKGFDNSTLTTVSRQLQVVKNSSVASNKNAVLYYKTVGKPGVIRSRTLKRLCSDAGFSKDGQCVNRGHHEQMSEQHIFQDVYDYCGKHESHTVVYLKTAPGFFHWKNRTRKQQFWWRHHLTEAATSKNCLDNIQASSSSSRSDQRCDVCGLQFTPLPAIAFPGNMWSAKCSYIRRLINPADFNEVVADLVEEETRLADQNRLLMTLYDQKYSWSRGARPAHIWEQWVASHPSLRPCDLSNTSDVRHWFTDKKKTSTFKWSRAPRSDLLERRTDRTKTKNRQQQQLVAGTWFELDQNETLKVMNDKETRRRDYFLLAGNVVKWLGLYGKVPSKASWVWSWFPDSKFWKDAVQRHGRKVIDESFSGGWMFPENGTTSTPFAIFYNIYVDPLDKFRIDNALNIVEEQIAQVGTSFANRYPYKRTVSLYYSTVGGPIHRSWMISLCRMHGVNCNFLKHWDEGDEDVTLQRIHDYCGEHPNNTVAYIHSKGSYHSEEMDPMWAGQNRWRRHMTDAVLSKSCLEPANSTCNACGLLFQPIPSEHFPGNMWTAKCSYIRQLAPPGMLRLRRTRAIQAVEQLMKQKRNRPMDAKFCPYDPLLLGLSRFFAEHWIGTHPSIRPCDLSATPSLEYWKTGDRNMSDHAFDMAPRHRFEADWDFYNYCNYSEIVDDDAARLKEYFLLPGHLFRWIKEYNVTAPDESWIWSWYPDGAKWKNAVKHNWLKAFNVVTKQQKTLAGLPSSENSVAVTLPTPKAGNIDQKDKQSTIPTAKEEPRYRVATKAALEAAQIQWREKQVKLEPTADPSNNKFQLGDKLNAMNVAVKQNGHTPTVKKSNERKNDATTNKLFQLGDTMKVTNQGRHKTPLAKKGTAMDDEGNNVKKDMRADDKTNPRKAFRQAEISKAINVAADHDNHVGVNENRARLAQTRNKVVTTT